MPTSTHNVDAANMDLYFKKNDSIHISFEVEFSGIDFILTNYIVELKVYSVDINEYLLRTFTNDNSLEIDVALNIVTIQSDVPFIEVGKFYYRMNVSDTDSSFTIAYGALFVEN
jgi:hypothetical protein